MKHLPFKETALGDNRYIREFSTDIDSHELEWHIDKEDRIIETIENNGWKIQLDNQLPKTLNDKLFIPKETYHRVIKGDGKLIVKITKL
jgi:hypothetical protein